MRASKCEHIKGVPASKRNNPKRKVKLAHMYILEHEFPESWSNADVEFFFNGSCHCASNEVDTLSKEDCCCMIHSARVVNEEEAKELLEYGVV